jgi:hypothetical protein
MGQTPNISQWALPAIAVMLLAYGAVSGRLRSTPVSQAMVFVALGLLAGNGVLDLVEADRPTSSSATWPKLRATVIAGSGRRGPPRANHRCTL